MAKKATKKNDISDFFAAVEDLAKEKGFSAQFIYDQFRESIVKAAKRQDAEARKLADAKIAEERRKAEAALAEEKANAARRKEATKIYLRLKEIADLGSNEDSDETPEEKIETVLEERIANEEAEYNEKVKAFDERRNEIRKAAYLRAEEALKADEELPEETEEEILEAQLDEEEEAEEKAFAEKNLVFDFVREIIRQKAYARAQAEEQGIEYIEEEIIEEDDEEETQQEEEKPAGETENIFCDINPEEKTIKIYRVMKIVDTVINPRAEMTVDQAQNYTDKAVYVGDSVTVEVQPQNLGKLFAMNVKGIIRQAISEEEKRKSKRDINEKDREVVTAKVEYISPESGNATLMIGTNRLTLLREDQLPGEVLSVGQDVKVYVTVSKENGMNGETTTYANLSRREPGLVKRLFEMEVPEIFDGVVEIVSISREAGSRTKIAVNSKNPDVDPVGACIGPKGQRVSTVINALCGEKIDIVRFSEKSEDYIAAALAPAKVISVEIAPEVEGAKKTCFVVVPNDQLSLAIGNKGQNVRLAAKLTGWKIDIKPETEI